MQMQNRATCGLSLVLASLLITDDARKILEIAAEKTGCIKLASFEKTNGQKQC